MLGGTGWLGRQLARQGVARGHHVTCPAHGRSGPGADGAVLVASARREPEAHVALANQSWDAVVEVSWQPSLVRGALTRAAPAGQALDLRLVRQRVRLPHHPRSRRTAQVLLATDRDEVDRPSSSSRECWPNAEGLWQAMFAK